MLGSRVYELNQGLSRFYLNNNWDFLGNLLQCCGSSPFFRIRIRGFGFQNPDPGDPDPT